MVLSNQNNSDNSDQGDSVDQDTEKKSPDEIKDILFESIRKLMATWSNVFKIVLTFLSLAFLIVLVLAMFLKIYYQDYTKFPKIWLLNTILNILAKIPLEVLVVFGLLSVSLQTECTSYYNFINLPMLGIATCYGGLKSKSSLRKWLLIACGIIILLFSFYRFQLIRNILSSQIFGILKYSSYTIIILSLISFFFSATEKKQSEGISVGRNDDEIKMHEASKQMFKSTIPYLSS